MRASNATFKGPGRRLLALHGLLVITWIAATIPAAPAQDPNDAISREFSVFNDLNETISITDAVSREFTVYNELIEPIAVTDVVSREFSVLNESLSSSSDGMVALIDTSLPCVIAPLSPTCGEHPDWVNCDGLPDPCPDPNCVDLPAGCPDCAPPVCAAPSVDELSCELGIINAGPLPELNLDWEPITCRTSCEGIYNAAYTPLTVDAVTYDNDSPAFYKWTFELPPGFSYVTLEGVANVDDQGILFLNGHRLTGRVGCQTWGDDPNGTHPWAPAYPATDAAGDRILTWPTLDQFGVTWTDQDPNTNSYFLEGTNELVFALSGSSSAFNPSGLEFAATIHVVSPGDCESDTDGDGVVDCNDQCQGYDDNVDCNGNGTADGCDIINGTSDDCDGNGVPDECEYPGGGGAPSLWDMAVLLDGSGSISSTDFGHITEGLALAVLDPDIIEPTGRVTLTVIQFAGGLPGGAAVEIGPVNIDSSATASGVAADIRAIAQAGGGTPMGEAIDLAVSTILPGRPNARKGITLLTDGNSNGSRDPIAAADDAIAAGLHEIDAIAVGNFDLNELEQVVRPQPDSPGPPPEPGFVTIASSFQEVRDAFGAILDTVLNLLSIETDTLPAACFQLPYQQTLLTNNGCGYLSWSIISGSLPAGLALDADGTLYGTPTELGTFNFVVEVTDSALAIASAPLTLESIALLGDLDYDGVVGPYDLAMLISHYGEPSGMTYEDGDLNGDGDVDLSDLAALLGNYGQTCP